MSCWSGGRVDVRLSRYAFYLIVRGDPSKSVIADDDEDEFLNKIWELPL